MRFSDLKSSILKQFSQPEGFRSVPFIVGKPGGGKSACAREIAQELAKFYEIPAERIIEFNPSLREPTDILGLPLTSGDHSRWLPPEEFYAIRKGMGPSILIIEELSDAQMDMQNPLCRVILDRHAGQMPLADELYIIATGNRTEDRSGASRLSTKLANRLRILNFDENLNDWLAWADVHGVPEILKAFLRFRPALLSDFDPARSCNPTPRSWEDVGRIPTGLRDAVFAEHVAGCVGKGAAAEYVGFMRTYNTLPDLEEILANPTTYPVQTEPDRLYAITSKLAHMVTKTNFEAAMQYLARHPKEFQVLFLRQMLKKYSWVAGNKTFQAFAAKNMSLLV